MGEIWLARDLALERTVAVKVLRADLTQDAPRLTRFRQEARAASALNHPNVCTIHALGETADGQQFIAMEHVDGETLRQRLARSQIPLGEALDIAVQVTSALTSVHESGVVHRDLKPENVMVRRDGLVKVVDFGLAKLAPVPITAADATGTVVNTDAGTILGTVSYMSPEQARAQDVGAAADIWSVGVIVYEMVTGRNPFTAPSTSEVFAAILDREPPPLARFAPDAPIELQRIVTKTLRKNRAHRYQSTRELLLDLQVLRDTLVQQTAGSRVDHASTTPLSDAHTSRTGATIPLRQSSAEYLVTSLATHKLGAALTACVVVLLAAAGWWMASRRESVPNATPSVVVLPFSTIGAGDQYFADGITEAVTTELGRVGGLRVIAANTAFGYRNKGANRDIARELGVGLVIRGSVQHAGERVRIDVTLVETSSDTALWSERYNREVADVLALQDEISRQIATTLSNTFGAMAPAPPRSLGTRHPEAVDAYLRGLWHLNGHSSDTLNVRARVAARRSAVEHLGRAVALDPKFALAHATLASAYTQQFFYDSTDRGLERTASGHIDLALAIAPDLAEAYLARAQLTWTAVNDFPHEAAIKDLRSAVSINPNLAQAYIELEKVYYHIGLTAKAVEANERANRLDPSQAALTTRAFRALVDAGQLREVQVELGRQRNLGDYARGEALVAMGRLHDALQLLSNSRLTLTPTDPEYDVAGVAMLAVVYARMGRRDDAERMIATAIPAAHNRTALSHMHHAQFNIGATLAWLGRHDEAVAWLTKAAVEGYPSYPKFSADESLAPLRRHAGFQALLARLRKDWDRWRTTL